jgi:hypothetical protein
LTNAHQDTAVDRRRKQVASTYRKQGYRVTVPTTPDMLPAFLRGCQPDLIAEKDGDLVVIEVKRANAVRHSNDLDELADRVAATPGWRLELVAMRSEDETTGMPAADWLDAMLSRRAHDDDMIQQCIYLGVVLEHLLQLVASREKLRAGDKTATRLAAELTYHGVIDQSLLERINGAFAWRSALVHGMTTPRPPAEQASEIESICRELLAQSMAEA